MNKGLNKFKENGCDSLVSVREVPHEYNPHWTFRCNDIDQLEIATGEKEIITRRQDLPKAYHRDGSIYITKTSVIMEKNSLYGDSIAYVESNEKTLVNIDTPEDWVKAEEIFKNM